MKRTFFFSFDIFSIKIKLGDKSLLIKKTEIISHKQLSFHSNPFFYVFFKLILLCRLSF